MTGALITKYRPETWDDIFGHETQVRSLRNAVDKHLARVFLFTGPSGTGKTTLARITATELGCRQPFLEVDAATKTGIDAMREVQDGLMYRPLEGSNKGIIIDEFHALSKAAVQSLLKIFEDPPEWVYWFLCTTESTRVLETVRTRSLRCDLKPLSRKELLDLLAVVARAEKLADGPHGAKLLELCASEANGSPRQALSNLAQCAAAKSLSEAQELLNQLPDESAEAVDLARALVKGCSWGELQVVLNKLQGANPESVRHVVRAYVTKVVLGTKSEPAAGRGLEILDAFSQPFHSSDGISPLVLACGRVVLS